jgi:BA14K-like protein
MLQLMPRMKKPGIAITTVILATLVLATLGGLPSFAQGLTPVGWYYDGRDDGRDFPTNGFFPGDFAADPASAAIGAAGLFGSTPTRSYPAQFTDGSQPDQNYCARRYRSYHPASGTFIGYDGARHRCR